MKEPVVVKMDVTTVTSGTLMGTRESIIADSLTHSGIPAYAGPHGIAVRSGTLDVGEENGLRVFTWHPPEDEVVPMQQSVNTVKANIPPPSTKSVVQPVTAAKKGGGKA